MNKIRRRLVAAVLVALLAIPGVASAAPKAASTSDPVVAVQPIGGGQRFTTQGTSWT